MTTRTTAGIAAGMLAIGIVVGAAGTIVADDGSTNASSGFMGTAVAMNAGTMGAAGMNASSMGAAGMNAGTMADMARMMSTMGAGTMADMARMMSTMGAGTSTSPDPSALPEDHELHHSSPSPSAT